MEAGKSWCWVSSLHQQAGSPRESHGHQRLTSQQSFLSAEECLEARSQGRWGQPRAWRANADPGVPNQDKAGNCSDCNKLVIVFEEGD